MSATILDDARGTRSLGVLFMDESAKSLTRPFFASVLNAFKMAAEARGYDVTFINHRIGGGHPDPISNTVGTAISTACASRASILKTPRWSSL